MADNLKYVRKLLQDAKKEGMFFRCYYDEPTDPDYLGDDIEEAIEALTACDVMMLRLVWKEPKEDGKRCAAVVTIIPDITMDPEEVIADYRVTPWMEAWWNANVGRA
jgi:hypothetical protein